MRQFYNIMLLMLLSMIGFTANAQNIKVTLNIDDPDKVSVQVNYVAQTMVAGNNEIELEPTQYGYYPTINVKAVNNALLTAVTKSNGNKEYVNALSECNIYPSSADDGATWTITTSTEEEFRTASVIVKCDHPDQVQIQRSGSNSYVTLTENEQVVKYNPQLENTLYISPRNYGTSFYSVTFNDTPIAINYNSYTVNLDGNSNSVLDIQTAYPEDMTYNFRIEYADAIKANGFITSVTADGETVDLAQCLSQEGVELPAGKSVVVSGNTQDYKYDSFTVNDQNQNFYGTYSFNITSATVIKIDAHKYGNVTATVNIDDPNNISVFNNTYDDGNPLTLEGNTITLSERNANLYFKPASGCSITSFKVGEEERTADYNGAYFVTVADGMVINITTEASKREDVLTIWVDDVTAITSEYGIPTLTFNDRSTHKLSTGENIINFNKDKDVPMQFSSFSSQYQSVFLNDTKLAPLYSGGTSYQINTLNNGDYMKVYLASLPETYKVNFKLGLLVSAADVAAVKCNGQALANWSEGVEILNDAAKTITIEPAVAGSIVVKVGDKTIEATDGAFVVNVNGDTDIEITEADATQVETVNLKLVYNGEAEGCVSELLLDGTPYNVADFATTDGVNIKAGKKITVKLNKTDYNVTSFTVNDVTQYFNTEYTGEISSATVISITATKYKTLTATVNIDNADNVKVFNASYDNNMPLSIVDNKIEVNDNNPYLYIKPNTGCYIISVTADGNAVSKDYNGGYSITVTDGMVINVESAVINRDQKLTVWVDDASATTYGAPQITWNDRSTLNLQTGENVAMFYEGDVPMQLSAYGSTYMTVFLNDTKVAPAYTGATYYVFNTLASDSYIKMYLASEPSVYNVSVVLSEKVSTTDVASITVNGVETTNWSEAVQVLADCKATVVIKPADESAIAVKVGDEEYHAQDGVITVVVDNEAVVNIVPEIETGIDNIGNIFSNNGKVYNLQGVELGNSKLTKGIYIVNGKKVAVTK